MAAATRGIWLVKSEPSAYSFDQLVADGQTAWTGVRNYTARNNLRAMKKGDTVLFYHSNEGKAVVGLARVSREAYQDPTTGDDWSAVDVEPVRPLPRPVTLAELKADPVGSKMAIIRLGRLSVTPVTAEELDRILDLGKRRPQGFVR
jgi:predicted RNA-binding protein with PUA-like domain